jgi:hypothetical protein
MCQVHRATVSAAQGSTLQLVRLESASASKRGDALSSLTSCIETRRQSLGSGTTHTKAREKRGTHTIACPWDRPKKCMRSAPPCTLHEGRMLLLVRSESAAAPNEEQVAGTSAGGADFMVAAPCLMVLSAWDRHSRNESMRGPS